MNKPSEDPIAASTICYSRRATERDRVLAEAETTPMQPGTEFASWKTANHAPPNIVAPAPQSTTITATTMQQQQHLSQLHLSRAFAHCHHYSTLQSHPFDLFGHNRGLFERLLLPAAVAASAAVAAMRTTDNLAARHTGALPKKRRRRRRRRRRQAACRDKDQPLEQVSADDVLAGSGEQQSGAVLG